MDLRIAVCDDEYIISEKIKEYIFEYNDGCCVDLYRSGLDLLNSFIEYDMIILDIEMPDANGMVIAEKVRKKGYTGEIIFLTGHSEYIEDAFKVRAFRFLHKPIIKDKLYEALNAVWREERDNSVMCMKQYGKEIWVRTSEIIYIEAYGDGTYFYTINGVFDSHLSLKNCMEKLNKDYFFLVHKSYIVSFEYIETMEENMIVLKLLNEEIPLARRRRKEFRTAYYKYIRNKRRW